MLFFCRTKLKHELLKGCDFAFSLDPSNIHCNNTCTIQYMRVYTHSSIVYSLHFLFRPSFLIFFLFRNRFDFFLFTCKKYLYTSKYKILCVRSRAPHIIQLLYVYFFSHVECLRLMARYKVINVYITWSSSYLLHEGSMNKILVVQGTGLCLLFCIKKKKQHCIFFNKIGIYFRFFLTSDLYKCDSPSIQPLYCAV